jgi:hypothetical protein
MKLRKAIYFFLFLLLAGLGVKAQFYPTPPIQTSIELSGDSLQQGTHAPVENAEEESEEEAIAPNPEQAVIAIRPKFPPIQKA